MQLFLRSFCVNVHQYLEQIMAIATSETMQTPPTKDPAIRDSCCPSSDLYSSARTQKSDVSRPDQCFNLMLNLGLNLKMM